MSDDILDIPDTDEPQNSNLQVSGRFSKVIAGGLFALFFGAIIQALAVFGVITATSGHIFMFIAWIAGALIITTELIPGKPTRHKVIWVTVLGVVLLCVDLISARYATTHEQSKDTLRSLTLDSNKNDEAVVSQFNHNDNAENTSKVLPPSHTSNSSSSSEPIVARSRVQAPSNKEARKQTSLYLARARALYDKGKNQAALIQCKKVLDLDPNNKEALDLRDHIKRTIDILESN